MQWHRLFGLMLTDFFTGSPYVVEIEKDLSQKKQLLDVVIVRRVAGTFHGTLPDGFEDLGDHNLISFKSHQDQFDAWALTELLGHFVNYRKQISPSMQDLLPEDAFRLFAVCARFPQQLRSRVMLEQRQDGVFDCDLGIATVRIVVAGQMAEREQNAMLHLFSAQPQRVEYGRNHYQQHSDETSTLLKDLLTDFQREGGFMPYTMEDYKRDRRQEVLAEMSPEEILQGLSPEQILRALTPEQVLQALSPEQLQLLKERIANRDEGNSAGPSGSAD